MQGEAAGCIPASDVKVRFRGPIWTLVVLSPVIAEVLSGSTRLSTLFALVPEVMVWGVGALLCRELARRWRAGWVSLLLLGMGLSVAEEFLVQQTSIAPLPFPGAHADYGRMWGVNLIYFLFMLAYESVWVVVIPVGVAELLFPKRRQQTWLRKWGLLRCCWVFLIGCRIAWYGWTQRVRPMLHAVPYHPPLILLGAGLAATGMLVLLAYLLRDAGRRTEGAEGGSVPAWVAGAVACVMGAAWFELMGQNFVPNPVRPFWIVLAAGVAWALVALVLFAAWSARPAWSDVHRWAACFGATLGCEAMGYLGLISGLKIDLVGKMVFDAAAVTGFVMMGRRVVRAREELP